MRQAARVLMPGLAGTDVAVLCGGLGTRLRAAVPRLPKCLAPVRGRPFLHYLIEQVWTAGCSRVVLCTGVGAAAVREFCAGQSWEGQVVFSEEDAPLGTGGALANARYHLTSDPVLVVNGDSLVPNLDFGALQRMEPEAPGLIVVVPCDGRADTGRVSLSPSGEVRGFAEKPAAGPDRWQNAGVYRLRQRWLAMLTNGASSLERDWLPRWAAEGMRAYRHPGRVMDIGTPERWMRAQEPWT